MTGRPASATLFAPSGLHIASRGPLNSGLLGGEGCENEVTVPVGEWVVLVPYHERQRGMFRSTGYANFQAKQSFVVCKEGGVAIRIFGGVCADTTMLKSISGLAIRYHTSIAAAADTVEARWDSIMDVDSLYVRAMGVNSKIHFGFR